MTKSATVTITNAVGDGIWFASWFNVDMYSIHPSKTEFDLRSEDGAQRISFFGEDFKYRNGYLLEGTFTGFEAKQDGKEYASAENLDIAFHKIKLDLTDTNGQFLLKALLQGTERDVGSKNADVLYGLFGQDTLVGKAGADLLVTTSAHTNTTLTGGRGSDWFVFMRGEGKETVTDFHATGGGTNQDYISYDDGLDDPRIYQDHQNTVLDFGHHFKVVLLDVDRADITADDFKPYPDLSYLT